jgi:hypothetical protein
MVCSSRRAHDLSRSQFASLVVAVGSHVIIDEMQVCIQYVLGTRVGMFSVVERTSTEPPHVSQPQRAIQAPKNAWNGELVLGITRLSCVINNPNS